MATDSADQNEEEGEDAFGSSPDACIDIVFANRPEQTFVGGEVVHSLLNVSNNAGHDFIVTGIVASFRYPQDYSYSIQDFPLKTCKTRVPPRFEASFVYNFKPSMLFLSQRFALLVDVYYRDTEGNEFRDAVFNKTVDIVEAEEKFDVERFFVFVCMISALCTLMDLMYCDHFQSKRALNHKKGPH